MAFGQRISTNISRHSLCSISLSITAKLEAFNYYVSHCVCYYKLQSNTLKCSCHFYVPLQSSGWTQLLCATPQALIIGHCRGGVWVCSGGGVLGMRMLAGPSAASRPFISQEDALKMSVHTLIHIWWLLRPCLAFGLAAAAQSVRCADERYNNHLERCLAAVTMKLRVAQ